MNKRITIVSTALLISTAVLFAGCLQDDPETLIARADQSLVKEDFRAAIIDLKTALQVRPKDARARWMLAEAYLGSGDGANSEKEIRRAEVLGVGREAVVLLLARALVMQKRMSEVLELEIETAWSAETRSELWAMRGLAYLDALDIEQAKIAAKRALSASPQAVDARFVDARISLAENDDERAESALEQITFDHPKYAAAWSLLGDIYSGKGDLEAAIRAFSKSLVADPKRLEDLSKRAMSRAALGDIVAADKDGAALREIAPKYHMGFYIGGVIKLTKGETEQAKDLLERALVLSEQDFYTVFALAVAETSLGNENRARQLAENALTLQPNYIPARKLAAYWMVKDGEGGDAEVLVRPILVAKPDDLQAWGLLASSLLQQNRTLEATEVLKSLAARKKDDFDTQMRIGAGLLSVGAAQAATDVLSRAVKLRPEDNAANATLLSSLVADELPLDAVNLARAYADSRPHDPLALNALGAAYLAAGDSDAAERTFNLSLEEQPGNMEAIRYLIATHLAGGQPERALTYTELGLKNDPNNLALLLLHAEANKELGNDDLYMETLKHAVAQHPNQPGPRVLLARVYLRSKNAGGALDLLSSLDAGQNIAVLATRAEAYYQNARLADARDDLETLSRLLPGSLDVQIQLAQILDSLGEKEELASVVDRVLTIAPGTPSALLAKARIAISDGRLDEAAEILRDPRFSASRDPDVMLTKVALARANGDFSKEARFAQTLFSQDATKRHLLMVTRAMQRAGEVGEAEAMLRRWLESNPSDVGILTELSNLLAGQDAGQAYLKLLRRVLAEDAENVLALNNLAWALRDSTPVEARGLAFRAYVLAPNHPTVVDTYVTILGQSGDPAEALRILNKASDRSRLPPSLEIKKAEFQLKLGQNEVAASTLNNLLAGNLDDDMRRQVEAMLARILPER